MRNIFFIYGLILVLNGNAADIDKAQWEQGRNIFKVNCASCHNPTIAQTGPALTGVTKRWEDAGDYNGKTGKQWLYDWIRNWSVPVNAKYPYAVRMQNYSVTQMNIFPSLNDHEIDALLLYIENSHSGIVASDDQSAGSWGNRVIYILFALVGGALLVLYAVTRRNKSN